MIKLTHRLAPFVALTPSDPVAYGFNCFQAAIDPWTSGDEDQVVTYVENAHPAMGVLLAITPKTGSAYFSGTVTNTFEDAYRGEVERLKYRLGQRVQGVRLNHEYRPSAFAQAPGWISWLQKTNYAMWQYIVVGQKRAWEQLLRDTATWMNPVQFLESTTGTAYDGPGWSDFRKTFKLWIDYRCQWSAVIINRLADITDELGLPFYAYPGGRVDKISPRVMPREEYTLDQDLLNSRIIMEAGTWNTRDLAWCRALAASIDGSYIWTMQIDTRRIAEVDAVADYNRGMSTVNMAGNNPIGYGLWTDWRPDVSPELTASFQKYLDSLAGGM